MLRSPQVKNRIEHAPLPLQMPESLPVPCPHHENASEGVKRTKKRRFFDFLDALRRGGRQVAEKLIRKSPSALPRDRRQPDFLMQQSRRQAGRELTADERKQYLLPESRPQP